MDEPENIKTPNSAEPVASVPLNVEQMKALAICLESGRVSISEVQRKLRITFNESNDLCQSLVDAGYTKGLQHAPSLRTTPATPPAAAPAPAVPEGWKLVPVEPVPAMTWAATVTADREWCYFVGKDDAKKLWAAMLAATPAAPAQEPVTLTDQELYAAVVKTCTDGSAPTFDEFVKSGLEELRLFSSAIIAALREKQGGV